MTAEQSWQWVERNNASLVPIYDENERKKGYLCMTELTTWIEGTDARNAVEKCAKLLEGDK
jgi:hypothetical protein